MQKNLSQLSHQARTAVQQQDWPKVATLALEIQQRYNDNPEGFFLRGLVENVAGKTQRAIIAFSKALSLDPKRYDAAVELANQYLKTLKHGEAYKLLCRYEQHLTNSPLYLDMAARIYTNIGMHAKAWPLYLQANRIQPDIDMFQSNQAACAVLLGKKEEAKRLYLALLKKYPSHQRCHYELSRLETAKDDVHVVTMKNILSQTRLPANRNIYLYYAIGKELEDLGKWKEAFSYFEQAGKAVLSVAKYDVNVEINLIDKIIEVCNADWLLSKTPLIEEEQITKTPIFIVGLPRTGTTLTERIISSHSQVESADETFFMQMAIRAVSGDGGMSEVDEIIIEQAAQKDIKEIHRNYMNSVAYRLTDRPFFIDKYPYNFLYLGFIAKAFPQAHIVYLRRNPMDTCFAMYKQSFFKHAYCLEDLGHYYVAQERLRTHWQKILGDRLIEVDYESLIMQQEIQTHQILGKLGLKFEKRCMDFEKNPTASASASTLQVREKIHYRSLNKWRKFHQQLLPLQKFLSSSGIDID